MISWPRRRQVPWPARDGGARGRRPVCVVVFLGAVWINDALMLAARDAHAAGARCVYLLYDLTPVLETGHTAAVNRLFDRYLTLVAQTASRVPAISRSSRTDFEAYCRDHGWAAPPGGVTGLPCGITPEQFDTTDVAVAAGPTRCSSAPWSRARTTCSPCARGRDSSSEGGPDAVPDLVCVGRLGWHADAFLDEYVRTRGLDGKVSVLSSSISDAELARFYAHADFTVYPSRYEGWGLPVSESLAFGKLPVVAYNSSLPGGRRRPCGLLRLRRPRRLRRGARARALDLDARRSGRGAHPGARGSRRSRGRRSHRSCSTRWLRPPPRK